MGLTETTAACDHWIGAERRHCQATKAVRAFLVGPRCPAHTPNALKGLPEPGQPATPQGATP